jgi:hypothetical protein
MKANLVERHAFSEPLKEAVTRYHAYASLRWFVIQVRLKLISLLTRATSVAFLR